MTHDIDVRPLRAAARPLREVIAAELGAVGIDAASQFAHSLQQLLRQRQHAATVRVEMQPALMPLEQRRAQQAFHFGQCHARRRLGQVQLFGGGADAAGQGDGDKDLELARADCNHQDFLSTA